MGITCPACAKKNDLTGTCVRCGCDLSALRQILFCALSHLAQAKFDLQQGDSAAALADAERSWQLVHTAHSAQVASVAAAALGDIAALARWRCRTAA